MITSATLIRTLRSLLWNPAYRGGRALSVRIRCFLIPLFCTLTSPVVALEVLFDQGHGQRFVIEREGELELSQLAQRWRQAGHGVQSSQEPLSVERLQQIDLLVIAGAFAPFDPAERQAIRSFVETGGVVLLALHVGPLNGPLLADLGIAVSNGVVMERTNRLNGSGSDFRLSANPQHPLTQGFQAWSLYGGWALNPGPEAEILASASEAAWMDLNRNRRFDAGEPVAAFVMAAIKGIQAGSVVVLGDDAMLQNRFLSGDNAVFVDRLVQWVTSRNQ